MQMAKEKYTVCLWSGAGYYLHAIEVYEESEEEALSKAVLRAFKENHRILGFKATEQEIKRICSNYKEEIKNYENEDEFITNYLNYHFLDSIGYYIHMDNTRIEKGWELYNNRTPMRDLYEYVGENYLNMSKEQLRGYIVETLYRLSNILNKTEYLEICDMIEEDVDPSSVE
jgi:hypothetical protein